MTESFLNGRVVLHSGDMREVLATLPDNSIDACVTDPPYHLTSIVKRFGGNNAAPAQHGKDGAFARASRGFMGKQWDGGEIAFEPETWAEVLRVLKPGGHVAAFGATKNFGFMQNAMVWGGFEVRDVIAWLFGSGFPKSHDVSRSVDKLMGAESIAVGTRTYAGGHVQNSSVDKLAPPIGTFVRSQDDRVDYAPATPEAAEWEGWGTALKPAWESIIIARKPTLFWDDYDIIGSQIAQLESRLWSMLPASTAERNFGLSRSAFDGACASAQWSADERNSTRAALSEAMGTSRFVLALTSSLSTVSSWRRIWAEGCQPANTSITETALSTTTELRTSKFCLLKITPESIMQAHRSGLWSIAHASIAERIFNATAAKLSAILESHALASAIEQFADHSLGVGGSPEIQPIVLARKPLSEGTVAANVLRWGTGALNISACRINADGPDLSGSTFPGGARSNRAGSTVCTCCENEVSQTGHSARNGTRPSASSERDSRESRLSSVAKRVREEPPVQGSSNDCPTYFHSDDAHVHSALKGDLNAIPSARDADRSLDRCAKCGHIREDRSKTFGENTTPNIQRQGRWPANVITDGSDEVVGAFPSAGGGFGKRGGKRESEYGFGGTMQTVGYGDSGSAARFFYSAKADADDRIGSKHPTVKPVDLMQWLVRLITPPGGTILDPFAGTGTTGEAAFREGFRAILIEREAEYQADIRRRMALVLSGPEERARESLKASGKADYTPLPLFGDVA